MLNIAYLFNATRLFPMPVDICKPKHSQGGYNDPPSDEEDIISCSVVEVPRLKQHLFDKEIKQQQTPNAQ